MEYELGLRNRHDRLFDGWGQLDMGTRFGLSFVGAVAALYLILEVFDWFL